MRNIYLGLLFLHGHITNPEVFVDSTEPVTPGESKSAKASRATDRYVTPVDRNDAGNTCVAC